MKQIALKPLNVYGQTKALREQVIQNAQCNYLIFRTSWVFAQKGKNFLKTMLALSQQREELSIIDDQIGAPNVSRANCRCKCSCDCADVERSN